MATVTNFNHVNSFYLLAAPWSTWCFTWTVWASALPTPGWRHATSPSFGRLTFSGPHFHPRQLQLPRLSPPEWPPRTRLPWPILWLRQPTVRRDSTRGESTLRHHQHFQRIAGTKRPPYNGFHGFFIISQAHKEGKKSKTFVICSGHDSKIETSSGPSSQTSSPSTEGGGGTGSGPTSTGGHYHHHHYHQRNSSVFDSQSHNRLQVNLFQVVFNASQI